MLNDNFLHHLPDVESRAITAENPTGAPGEGGQAASHLGPGRKGRGFIALPPATETALADIAGAGTIRHIWITVPVQSEHSPYILRDLVLRAYWDGADTPAVEVPLGDFFCCGFAMPAAVSSLPVTVGSRGGMNSYWPMPFADGARITVENQSPGEVDAFFFQIDYEVAPTIADDVGRFHAQWRRSNGTCALGQDHTVLDGVSGSGAYVGTYLAIAQLSRYWYGEGEMKFFLDGEQHPTICGTGTEDYFGGAWAFQPHFDRARAPMPVPFCGPYLGYLGLAPTSGEDWSDFAPLSIPSHGMYRWHLPDPIRFQDQIKVTLQQIGNDSHGNYERSDDIATVAYWYQFSGEARREELTHPRARWPR